MSKLPEEIQNKLDEYLPSSGPTKYLETELYRAICKIAHDCDNNGFGNNWINPFIFICSMDQLHNHEILGNSEGPWSSPSFYHFYELKKFSPGVVIKDEEFNNISRLVNDIYDKVATWVYNHLDKLTPSDGVDMWNHETWPTEIEEIDLPDFENFGDPNEWEDQMNAFNHIVEGGWEMFEHKNYHPDNDFEYSRYSRDRCGGW